MKVVSVIEGKSVKNLLVTDAYAEKIKSFIENSEEDARPALMIANGVYPTLARLTGLVYIVEPGTSQYMNNRPGEIMTREDMQDPEQTMDQRQLKLIDYKTEDIEYLVIIHAWRLTLKYNEVPKNIQVIRKNYKTLHIANTGTPTELSLEEFLAQDTHVAMNQLFPKEMRQAMDDMARAISGMDSPLAKAEPATDTLQ